MKLGKLRPRIDPRTRKLATIEHLLPPAPNASDWSTKLRDLGPMLNNQIGDCLAAGAGHAVQAFTAANGVQIIPRDAAVLAMYIAISGYDPMDPLTDRGAYTLDALNYWRKTGVDGHKIDAYAALTLRNREHFKQAIHYYGGVYAGLWLPRSAEAQDRWHVMLGGTAGDPARMSWGGHCVWMLGYNGYGVLCITWGQLLWMSWAFLDTYCDEAFAVTSRLWADTDGAPSGQLYDALGRALPEVAT